MTSLMQAAEEYVPQKVELISDLKRVSVHMDVETKTYGEGDNEFTIDVVTIEGVDYRVPASVLGQLKALILDQSVGFFEFFRVLKVGTTMQDTKYTVIPELAS